MRLPKNSALVVHSLPGKGAGRVDQTPARGTIRRPLQQFTLERDAKRWVEITAPTTSALLPAGTFLRPNRAHPLDAVSNWQKQRSVPAVDYSSPLYFLSQNSRHFSVKPWYASINIIQHQKASIMHCGPIWSTSPGAAQRSSTFPRAPGLKRAAGNTHWDPGDNRGRRSKMDVWKLESLRQIETFRASWNRRQFKERSGGTLRPRFYGYSP